MFSNYSLVINAAGNAWPEEQFFYSLPDTGDTCAFAVVARVLL